MSKPFDKIAREHPLAFAAEAMLFALFFAAFLFLSTLRSSASTWSMIPHALINAGVVALIARTILQGRPPMYWNQFDLVVVLLFAWFIANVHYSEIRAVSWRSSALYFDSFGAYLFGRMLFYQRLRMYAAASAVTLFLAWFGARAILEQAAAQSDPSSLLIDRMEGILRLCWMTGGFWLIALPFLSARRPSNSLFLLFVAIVVGLYGLTAVSRLGWIIDPPTTEAVIGARHERLQNLETAWRIIQNYPLTGSGLGTFPMLFDAYSESPVVPYLASFSSYLYCVVEAGFVALFLLLYLLVRLPLYAVRRWRLFPNRRLRMATVVMLTYVILAAVHGIIDAAAFTPAAWLLFWANFGILVSLVVVRDPVQIFETAFAWKHAVASGTARPPERVFRPLPGSAFASTALGTLRRRRVPLPFKPRRPAGPLRRALPLLFGAALAIAVTVLQALPYYAARLAEVRPDETPGSEAHIQRLNQAVRVFPYASDAWSQMGEGLREQASGPLDVYRIAHHIEHAFKVALGANPYLPHYYEQLYKLYRETNNTRAALEIMKVGVRNNPNDLRLRLQLVRELERAGSLALASYHVKQAVTLHPSQVELYIRLAELYEQRGLRAKARRWLQYAEQVVPDSPEARSRLRVLAERIG